MAIEPPRGAGRRRLVRPLGVTLALVAAAVAVLTSSGVFKKGVAELRLPLRHDDIIRQQARDKGLDPALIAAVIYRESHFRPRRSEAGALGLMQILPRTARYIAAKSGGTRFVVRDLATPQINIAYGSWYLSYLLRRYHGDEVTALAAYNAGEGKVDSWLAAAADADGRLDGAAEIPYVETRRYVDDVLDARRSYRRTYRRELSL